MSAAPSVAGDPHRNMAARVARLAAVMASRPLCAALLVTALVTALRLTGTVDSDVAWQLWIASRLHAGAHLYRDIIEINPPLWFWMALPVDRVATLLHVRAEAVLIIAMGALAALSLAATIRLLPELDHGRRALLLAYAALILTAMPWMQVGQREQIVLIGALPYAALIAARREGRRVPTGLAILIGAGAALGFALKHYFLFVPVLLELWLAAGHRKSWRPVRPETLAVVAVGLAYAAAILLWARDFLIVVVPLVTLAYGVTGAPRLLDLIQPAVIVGGVTLALVASQRRALNHAGSQVGMALLVAASSFLLAYLVQAKGWSYHALPLLGCSSIGLAAVLASAPKPPRLLAVCAPAILLMPFAIAAQAAMREELPSPDLRSAVAGLRPGEGVGFIATDPAMAWSITLQRDLRYASRYMGFWMMRAVVRNEQLGGPNPRLAALGRTVVSETVTDFRCTPPQRIIVARPRPGEDSFDILPFFLRDREFAEFLSHYRVRSRTTLETYELASPLPAPAPSICRAGT